MCLLALGIPNDGFTIGAVAVAAIMALVRPSLRVVIAILAALCISGVHYGHYTQSRLPPSCFDVPHYVVGRIASFVEIHQGVGDTTYRTFDLNIQTSGRRDCGRGVSVRTFVSDATEPDELQLGDLISAEIQLRPPNSLWNRGRLPGNIHSLASGTIASGSVSKVRHIESTPKLLDEVRRQLSRNITEFVNYPVSERILQGLILGRKDALSESDWSLFRGLGIVHVLIVSGLHVSLVALWAQWWVLLPQRLSLSLNIPGSAVISGLGVCALTFIYVQLTGASLPAQRALSMMCTNVLMRAVLWRVSPLSSVVASAALLITINPWSALTAGFWLSVLLTGVILTELERTVRRPLFAWLRLTIVLTVLSSILSVAFFEQFSPIALFGNLLIAPIFTMLVLPMGLLGLAMSVVFGSYGGVLLSTLATGVNELLLMLKTVAPFESGNHLLLVSIHGGIWLMAAVVVGSVLSQSCPKQRAAWVLSLTLLLGGSSPVIWDTEVLVADVGQGTMIVLTQGDFTMLYDTGGVRGSGAAVAEREVVPWLQSRGIRQVDLLVVSHGDQDHSGGLKAVREHFQIARHWGFGGERCSAGRVLQPSQVLFVKVLMGTGQKMTDSNGDSCVILVESHGKTMLFPGDIPVTGELELIAGAQLPAHHGSATSTSQSFIDRLDPKHTVFTTKLANRFNHPNSSVETRVRSSHSRVWDTARDGAVTITVSQRDQVSVKGLRSERSPYWTTL